MNYVGTDSFKFKANDGKADSNTAIVVINGGNNPPQATDSWLSTYKNVAWNSILTATDADYDTLTYSIVNQPTHGTVSLTTATGAFTYTPNMNYVGTDSFTFKANDGKADSNTATVSITVNDDPDTPTSGNAPRTEVRVTSEAIKASSTCDKAGAFALLFESGVLQHGDQITIDLPYESATQKVTLCRDIDLLIADVAGATLDGFNLGGWDALTLVTANAPVIYSGTMPTAAQGGVFFHVYGTAGTSRIAVDILGEDQQDAAVDGDPVSSLTISSNSTLTIYFLDQKTNSEDFSGRGGRDGIWVDGNGTAKFGPYTTAAKMSDNTLCIDISQWNSSATINGNMDSKYDRFTFIPSNPQIAHITSGADISKYACMGSACGSTTLGAGSACQYFDNETRSGYCTGTHSKNYLILYNSYGFEIGMEYQVELKILVNGVYGDRGVYFSNVPVSTGIYTSADLACNPAATNTIAGTYVYKNAAGSSVTPAAPMTNTCSVSAANRAVYLLSPGSKTVATALNQKYLYIDLPSFNYDYNLVNYDDLVEVQFSVQKTPCGTLITGTHCIGTIGCEKEKEDKAIIVAGYGDYSGNTMWNETQVNADHAFRSLERQGYSKGTIYYLSPNTARDVDGDGFPDVDADATNDNFEYAVKSWAADANNLLIYMVGHGSENKFGMKAPQYLESWTLNNWLTELQKKFSGKITIVYDACRSGSFIPYLTGKNRIVIATAKRDQSALFSAKGSLSFSFIFWGHIFNGDPFYEAYLRAKEVVILSHPDQQTPHVDANGNGTPDEDSDRELASQHILGKEIKGASDLPIIANVLPDSVLTNETKALIYAEGVTDLDGIARVWAVITPPSYSVSSPDTPITMLPTITLNWSGNNRYEAYYYDFYEAGTYQITIFAEDNDKFTSFPMETTVTKQSSAGGYRLAADFGSYGLYLYDGNNWNWIAGNPQGMAAYNTRLAADFGSYGLYIYDGSSWKWIAGNPEGIAGWGDRLAGDFGSYGLYIYDGISWNWIAGNPEGMEGWGTRLAADFGSYGLYLYDGSSWKRIASNPEGITAYGTRLAADFGASGLCIYDGNNWNWIAGNPEGIKGWGNRLAADFGSYGLYLYDGSSWKWIAANPESMAVWNDRLVADFGAWGIYVYDGITWTRIGGNPEGMTGVYLGR